MSTLTPKKQAIQDREDRILQLSRQMVLEGGYHGLGLDSLAEELSVSRGTIYNHFSCKEEIILALLVATMDKRRDMFQRAAAYPDVPRVRLAAIGVASELFVRLYPEHFRVEQIVKSDSIWDKTTEERRTLVKTCQMQCVGIVAGIVRDAIAQKHVALPHSMTPEAVVFGLWSMTEGAYSIIATSDSMAELGIAEPFLAIRNNIHHLLDGYGWTPLSKDTDFDAAMQKIATEVFAKEFARLKQDW
ncbi:TetR/AcrR family transcriptional regulator [Fuerstiella marisgermanici]|uniref:Bacterial regulatory proteins, tetR family n=1 Tax=Fuerstiella marisgermanici TaxID=1891926 RepID=A0A1P8WQF6_9PLAN|nr:TetR/AcrR family transcriptional regulator [Fuerstiella marisgermanici]APZ96287.1 Bacterial regulatory proteins, tetR family [Fuerstiella marisgermanici]